MAAPTLVCINPRIGLSQQFLSDLLTTAIEGGSNYWLAADKVLRAGKDTHTGLDNLSPLQVLGVRDAETGEAFDRDNYAPGWVPAVSHPHVTLDTITKGIEQLFKGPPLVSIAGDVYRAILTNGAEGGYDAGDADVILQLGLFGQVVYG